MSILTSTLKGLTKLGKALNNINNDTSKKLESNTSIFDRSREEILKKAKERKQKIIAEQQAAEERRQAALKAAKEKADKEQQEEEDKQKEAQWLDEEKKKKNEEAATEELEEKGSEIKTQKEEEEESPEELYKDDGTDYTKVLSEQDDQKRQEGYKNAIAEYQDWTKKFWANRDDNETFGKYLKEEGNLYLKQLGTGLKLISNFFLSEFRDVKHGIQMSINPTKERAREILINEATKDQINNENSVQFQLDKQDELQRKVAAEEEGGLTQEEIETQLDELSKSEEGQILKDWNQVQTELYEPSQKLNELYKLYEEANAKGNYTTANKIWEEMKPLRVAMLKKTYEYAFGETIEGETEEDIYNKVKELSGNKNLKWNDFLEGQVQQLIDKDNSAKEVQYKIMSLVNQYEIRSDYNIQELPVKKFLSVLENYGLVVGNEQEAAIRAPYMTVQTELQKYDAKIKKARESGNEEEALRLEKEKQNYKQGMSRFTDFMNDAFVEILQGRTDNISKTSEAVMNFFQSKEVEDLREFLTDPALFAQFEKDGVVDYKGLMKYLKNSDVVKKFGTLEGAYSMSAIKADKKAISTNFSRGVEYNLFSNYNVQDKGTQYLAGKYAEVVKKYLSEGGEIREGGYIEDEFTDEYMKNVLGSEYDFSVMTDKQKAKIRSDLQNYYREYVDLKGDNEAYEHFVNNYINGLEESGLRKGDRYTDDIALRIGRLDPEYAMNQYARLGASLEGLADMIQANPRATFHTSIAVALPFVGGVGAAGLLEGLGLSAIEGLEVSNILKTSLKAGSAIFGEVAEGQIINAILESQSYGGEPEPIWNLLDVGIGAIKAIPYIKFGANLGKFKTLKIAENGKGLDKALEDVITGVKNQHGSAELKLDQLTEQDKANLNRVFKNEGIGNIVNGSMTDYLKGDLSIDWEKLYKDCSTNRLTYLGLGEEATNKNILKKIQQQAFAKELDTMDKRTLDFLYKKAQKWFGDKTIIKNLLKEGGKEKVITEWLSGELNTLKRIGNVKAAYATTILAENAGGMNKALNEKFGGIIKSLEAAKVKATTPEQIAFLDEAIADARELWNNQRLLVLSFNEQNFDKALQLNKVLTDKFNEKYNNLSKYWKDEWGNGLVGNDGNLLAVADGGISSIEKRLIDKWLAGDKEGVVREILGNQEEYEKIGVRVYNAEEYKNAVKNMSNNMLTDGQKDRLGQILDVLNKVNNNSISIIELPDSLRKTITSLQGFMGYIERGGKQETIITLGSSLVGGVKNGKFNDIKVLCHELGHTLFGSLSKQVKSQLVAGLLKTLNGKEMGPDLLRKLVSGLSEGRINVLLDLYKKKDKTEFVEELAADMMSNAIVKGIKGDENSIQSVGKNIIDQMAKGEKIKEFVGSDQPFQIVGNKFVDMLVTLNNAIETSAGGYKELRGIMHYIAATILEGGEIETKAAKNWKEASKNRVFGRGKGFYGYNEMRSGTAMDNEGRILSLGQERYFKNTKILDEDGRLLRVYHGTNADPFEAFNIDFARKNSDIQGTFFSPRYDEAKGYGKNIGAYYLNVENPAPRDLAYKIWANFKGQTDRGVLTRLELQKRGYDGVISYGDEIIVFSPEQIKSIDNLAPTKSPKFMAYEEAVNKADFNYAKENADKVATMGNNITEFDVAKVYSTQLVEIAVQNKKLSIDDLSQLLSTKWLDTDLYDTILRNLDPKYQKRFIQAMSWAEERKGTAMNTLLQFWKDGKLDLTKEINGVRFSDILANLAPNITKDGYVEWAGIDLIKYLNGGNKEVYNKLFTDFMKLLENEYDGKVVTDVVSKFNKAGIEGNSMAEQYVNFTNKVQDSIKQTALNAGMSEELANSLAEDVVSRMFAGSFYYIGNLYYIHETSRFDTLVDDMAYGLLLKNKNDAQGATFNKLYNDILTQYEKQGTFDAGFANWLSKVNKAEAGDVAGLDPTDFRWNRYWKNVFNRLATRTHGFIEDALKGMGSIDLDKRYRVSFINKIDNRYSQVKAMIGKRVVDAGLDGSILNLDGLNQARSIEEVTNVYIQALKESDNVRLMEAMPDKADREALISQLEKIKTDGFTNKDYDWLLSDLETKYLSYSRDGQDLTNYFRASLTADEVSELNRIEENFAKSKNETIPATWTKDLKKSAEGIDEIFDDEEVQKQLGTLTEEMNNWNKLVEEGEEGGYNAVLDWMLKDDALKAFFNIENEYKFKDTVKKYSINSNMTTTSMKSAKKLVIKVNSDNDVKMGSALKEFIGKYVNVTTIAAKDADVGRIIQSAIDFVDKRRVYVGDGALADFFKLIGVDGKDSYSMKAVINQIIKVLEEEGIKNGATASQIFKDISNSYSFRFKTRMTVDGDVITKVGKRKRSDGTAVKFTWAFNTDSEKYRAAIDAYVDVLAQRHSTYGWFKLEEITDGSKQYVNELDQILSSKLDKSPKSLSLELGAKEANKLQGLKGYWLGTSVEDLHKLDDTAAVWHPDLFNNFLYKAYAQSSETFGKGDWLVKNIWRKGENAAANAMYFIFYNTVFGASAASQQIVTNTIEIAAKTMSELSEIPVDPKTYNDLRDLVGTLIPSEIMRREGKKVIASRAELDLPGRTSRLGEWMKNFASKTSALTWADKAAEGEVIKYALVSSLMDLGLNGESTKELVSKVLAKMADAPNVLKLSDGTDIMELERIFRTDPSKIKGQAKAIVDRLKSEGKLTDDAGRAAYRYIIELNELTDPLRYAAKQANFKKNAFFQISNIPELTQNIIAGQAGPANMRFINWASRKAGEYAFNIADAIARKDWEQLYKYGNSLMLRGLFATKIYAQVNKATNDTGGVNYREFMKNVFLPYAVFNMAFLSAFDLIEETARDNKELGGISGLLNSMYQGLFGFSDNLKGRLSYAYLYWRGQYWNIKNGVNILSEKEAASDYFSGPLSNIPVVNYIEEMVSKAASNRITKYFDTKVSGIYGNSPYDIASQNSFVNMIFNANVTQDAVDNRRQQNKANKLMYQEDGFSFLKDGQLTLGLNDFTRDSKYAYIAYNKFLAEKGLDNYLKLGTNYTELRSEYDKLYGQQKFYTSLQGLGVDVEEAKLLGQMDEELREQDWSELAGYERLSEIKQLSATYWADSVLNIAILQSASLKGLLDAGEGLTTDERKEFTNRVNKLTEDLIAEVEAQDAINNKMLYAKAYDDKFIKNMVKKYGNTYGEEMVIAASIKALVSGKKSQITKEKKAIHGKGNYYQKRLKQEGGADEIAIEVANYKNALVEQFYPSLSQGNQMIPNTMMYTHASMREDNPLSSKLSLNSALGAPIDVEWTKRNVMYQGLGTLGLDSTSAILTTKVLNSSAVSEQDKVDFCKDAIEYANKQGPMLADLTKASIAIPMLKHYTELYNTDPSVFDENPDMFHDAMNMLTVSRSLSDEDIKEEVRESIFKSKGSGSGSGSKGRKGSISFNKPANDLTKFQAFKRQFEQNIMGQEPLNKIAYKATKNGITPIQLSVGEAKAIDEKYSFIKPMSFETPKSEKTPDIVVKQVKTTSSKYSGKAIKQSNVYKTKRVL